MKVEKNLSLINPSANFLLSWYFISNTICFRDIRTRLKLEKLFSQYIFSLIWTKLKVPWWVKTLLIVLNGNNVWAPALPTHQRLECWWELEAAPHNTAQLCRAERRVVSGRRDQQLALAERTSESRINVWSNINNFQFLLFSLLNPPPLGRGQAAREAVLHFCCYTRLITSQHGKYSSDSHLHIWRVNIKRNPKGIWQKKISVIESSFLVFVQLSKKCGELWPRRHLLCHTFPHCII